MPSLMPRRTIYRGLRLLSRWQYFVEQGMTPLGRFTLGAGFAAVVFGIDTRMNLLHQAFALAVTLLMIGGLSAKVVKWRLRGRFRAARELPRFASVGTQVSYPVRLSVDARKLVSGCFIEERLPDPRPSLERFLDANLPDESGANRFDRALGYPRWLQLIRLGRQADKMTPRPLTAPIDQGQLSERLELRPLRRGYLRLPAILLSRSDPLGLFRARIELPCEQSLLVLPKRYPVPHLDLPGRRQYQPGGMTLASNIGDSREFLGLREYRSGDSPRNIHWPSWARSGKPQVKEYQDEFFTRHALVIDSFAAHDADPRFEAAVSIAASLCESIQDGDSLLDLMFVGTKAYCFTAGRGLAGTEQFLEILACARACTDQPFARLQQSVLQRAGQLSAAVCILLDFDAPRRAMIRRLQGEGLPLKVLVIAQEREADELLDGWNGETPTLIRPDKLAEDLMRL